MCELFGLSGKEKVNISRDLKEFYSHAPQHPNGWGLYLRDEFTDFFYKEHQRADQSARLAQLLSGRVRPKDAIAHIRYATVGYEDIKNTHPFRGRDQSGREWIFAHNGTIFESEILEKYFHLQKGETDSERIFLYLLDQMNLMIRERDMPLSEEDRFTVLEDLVARLAPKNKLNLLIYDGDILYAHTNFKASLYQRTGAGETCFSTTPLSAGDWTPLPFMRLLSYKDGQLQKTGSCHGHEYIPDSESIGTLYLMYSNL